ncbi:MAG: glucosaminidase domain-containing protein [Treponema sp.]|nr:glucosaminidase domain-containing protein [Treponema sp.]
MARPRVVLYRAYSKLRQYHKCATLTNKSVGNPDVYRKKHRYKSMDKLITRNFLLAVPVIFLLFSCASISGGRAGVAEERAPVERLQPPEYIMGEGSVTGEKLAYFLGLNNPQADSDFTLILAGLYIEEAAAEGVNHDTAFAQMCLETGYLRYGGLVSPEQNNFCGLGAIGPGQPGEVFPDPRTGVRAHIQHLKAYASEEPLNTELVDPRFKWVRRGSSPTIQGLSGTWAADRTYDNKIASILNRLYDFSFE